LHCILAFFFSSRRRHTRFSRDWSSDVCSSDLDLLWESRQGFKHLLIISTELSPFRHIAVKKFMGQYHCPVDEIAVDGDQLRIVAGLKVFPRKIVILGFGRIGGKYIPQHILLTRKLFQIFME